MALNEAGWFDRLPIEIHGSDGSTVAIEKARAGRYRQRAMRAIPQAMLEKYFIAEGGMYSPHPALTRRITSWSVVNLMVPEEVAPYARFPIVFCRNAFIYFSPQAITKVVGQLGTSMPAPRLPVRWRVGVAAQRHVGLLARGDRRRVRVRETGRR
jgi:Methylase of chemotaxis methyl-accepting proteins